VIDVVLVRLFASPAYTAVIVCGSEMSVVGGFDALGAGCVPADKVVVPAVVNTPLATAPDPSDVDVVVSVIVVAAVPETTTPVDVTLVVAVNLTDVPYPSGDPGVAVSVVVVGTAAADAIDVCAKYVRVNANKTLSRASKNRVSDCVETKTPFRTTACKGTAALNPVVGIALRP
jgi:hypothetical protein